MGKAYQRLLSYKSRGLFRIAKESIRRGSGDSSRILSRSIPTSRRVNTGTLEMFPNLVGICLLNYSPHRLVLWRLFGLAERCELAIAKCFSLRLYRRELNRTRSSIQQWNMELRNPLISFRSMARLLDLVCWERII